MRILSCSANTFAKVFHLFPNFRLQILATILCKFFLPTRLSFYCSNSLLVGTKKGKTRKVIILHGYQSFCPVVWTGSPYLLPRECFPPIWVLGEDTLACGEGMGWPSSDGWTETHVLYIIYPVIPFKNRHGNEVTYETCLKMFFKTLLFYCQSPSSCFWAWTLRRTSRGGGRRSWGRRRIFRNFS